MKTNDFDSLVNEKLKGPQRFDKFYCAVIAGAAATVVSAGVGVYSASQAGKGAKGGSPEDLYGSRPDIPDYNNNVDIPKFDATSGGSDLNAMLPQLLQASKTITKGGINARNQVFHESSSLFDRAGGVLSELSKGVVPQDVVDSTNRIIAERFGGAASRGGTSPDQAQTAFARNIGQTSQNQVDRFLSAAPTWESLADQFAFTPEEAAGTAINLLSQRYNYALGAGSLQKGIDENEYSAALNSARGAAQPDPQVVGARNDALLQQAMQGISGGNSNYLTSIGGVVNGLSGALASYKATQPNQGGYYGTADAALKATGASTAGYYAGAGGPAGGGGYYAY